ncbi:MAG: type IVB secretion system protein IcmH/DotU [Cyclobacteriaceae bacterium]|nr:type IVB secretion system protein IcmH/DotU [Cyclobacteriaceae bacterium]
MYNDQLSKTKKNLSDLSSECLILILQLRSTNDYGESEVLKSRVYEMFERFESNARKFGIDNDKTRLAKFALVAFLDETIISSSWSQKEAWLSDPLQIKLFETFNAGEEFFNFLNELSQKTSANKEVLEVYYLCLSLGFKGKYQLQSPENLRKTIDELNLELHPEAYRDIDLISPNGNPRQSFVQSVRSGLPIWVYPLCALIVFAIFYVIMSTSISGEAEIVVDFLKSF